MSSPSVEVVLCIPGVWADTSELIENLAKAGCGYIFAGRVLLNMETQESCELQFEGTDERMMRAFEAAGAHWKDTPEMDVIDSHKSVVYLIGNGGSVAAAHSVMDAANALLKAGGLGVKVESSGIAHPPQDWAEQCQYNYLFKSHASYVVYVVDDDVYSCGMHNFGLPDAIVNSNDSTDPAELLRAFTHYVLTESPQIKSGQTFSVDSDAPVYSILESHGIDYGPDSLFNNPFGTWRLKATK